jgi:hypothetical protein
LIYLGQQNMLTATILWVFTDIYIFHIWRRGHENLGYSVHLHVYKAKYEQIKYHQADGKQLLDSCMYEIK